MANRVEDIQPPINRDTACLAPIFRQNVSIAIAECNAAGWDAYLYEGCRSEELQQYYFAHGVTRAQHAYNSWHIYGLACDIISRQHQWDLWGSDTPSAWQMNVSRIFKSHGMKWGGDWPHFKDWPHFQFDRCKISPSPIAIQLLQTSGKESVWAAVGAN